MISEVPDDAWFDDANRQQNLSGLFRWDTHTQVMLWPCVSNHFYVAPLTNDDEIAELEATIAKAQKRLAELGKAQREGRTHADESGNGGE